MLKLVFGRSGYGKSEYCFSEIKKLVLSGCNDVLLITPEQYNFTAEKKLLKMLGESKINSVQNLSFTRLCNEISRIYGKNTLPVLSAGAKAVLMKRAIGKVKENLKIFNKKTDSAAFIDSIIKIYDEMKFCDIDYSDFGNASEKIEQQVLSDKLYDISIILREYERSVNGKYSDSSDDLSELYNKLLKFGYLSGKYVFVDGFSGFASNEYKIIELIIKYSKEAVITVPTESYGNENRYSFFSYVNKTVDKIVKTAQEAKVKIENVMLSHNYRTDNNYLKFCEKNIFSNGVKSIKEIPDSVRIYSAKSIEDECEYTAVKIKNLLKSGVRARDISVVCRDTNQYSGELSYSFKKYEIPYFDDERQSVKNQPLIVMVQYLLKTAIYSFRSEDIMSLAKTGLTNLSEQSVNSLENYIYIWNISGVKKWNKPFENSVKGFSCELSENDKAKLEAVNKSRKYLVSVINEFKYASKNADSAEISKAVYNALISFNANKNLKFLAKSLLKFGKNELALEQDRVWNLLMEILNDLAVVIGDEKITLKEYYKLFNLIVSFEDLGVLPQGIDNVQFGRADRIRFDNPKAVFILGANEGEFPKASQDGGILSENDRLILNKNNLELYSFGETLNYQEQFFAYNAISAPRSFLYVTFLGNDKNSSPSIIVNSLRAIFENIITENRGDFSSLDFIESEASAFEVFAETFSENSTFSQSLKKYFENDGRYLSVKLLSENSSVNISNEKKATELFGTDMYLSASRLEDYFNCRFRYFCKFGLLARPLQKADLNPMETGTVIHYVLENILSEIGSEKLGSMKSAQIHILVDKYLNNYFTTQLGNISNFTARFRSRFMRLSKMLYSVVSRLADEFSQSEFEACAFELKIDKDADVKPKVIELDNGTVQIRGSVDRVDMLEKNGEKYIRVVDYKSGNKDFKLSDVLYGLNLQMFVYLFTVCSDKNSRYSGIPAGVLYMHAARSVYNLSREKTKEDMFRESDKEFKMKGIVLYDENHDILKSMEKDLSGKYIPVKATAKGGVKGCFASFEELGVISRKIENLIKQMGNELHKGIIDQNPVNGIGHEKTCKYCDYSDVCANRRIIDKNEMKQISDENVVELLKEE